MPVAPRRVIRVPTLRVSRPGSSMVPGIMEFMNPYYKFPCQSSRHFVRLRYLFCSIALNFLTEKIRKYQNRRYYESTRSRRLSLQQIHKLIIEGYNIRVLDRISRCGLIWSWIRRIRKLLAATWPMSSGFVIALLKATPKRGRHTHAVRSSFRGHVPKNVCAYAQNLLARFANPCDVPFRSSGITRSPRRRTYKQMMEVGQQMINNETQRHANRSNTSLIGPCRLVLLYRPTRSDLLLLEVTQRS
jgi:hypothetical protein